jgi:hypothetical protein
MLVCYAKCSVLAPERDQISAEQTYLLRRGTGYQRLAAAKW